jgi:hypothetical protein
VQLGQMGGNCYTAQVIWVLLPQGEVFLLACNTSFTRLVLFVGLATSLVGYAGVTKIQCRDQLPRCEDNLYWNTWKAGNV